MAKGVSKAPASIQAQDNDPVDDDELLRIDTGDQMKVKQVMDEAVVKSVVELGFKENYMWDNIKLSLMVAACMFAMVAQFYPMPFPKSRPLLGICCASYFIASGVIQFIVTYIEQDCILTTRPHEQSAQGTKIRTQFPRFQDIFTIILQDDKVKGAPTCTVEFSVGEVFDGEGNFWEQGVHKKVQDVVQRYRKRQWDKKTESKKVK